MAPRLVLVGPPGAGKTTVGRAIAERWQLPFRDTDADVEQAAGTTVAEIFVEQGEERFRALERKAVAAALAEHDGVLALGGGAVLDETTRTLLRDHVVVYLEIELSDATRRVGFNRDRPLLLKNPRAQLHKMLQQRQPLYESVATLRVTTSGKTPEEVATEITETLP